MHLNEDKELIEELTKKITFLSMDLASAKEKLSAYDKWIKN